MDQQGADDEGLSARQVVRFYNGCDLARQWSLTTVRDKLVKFGAKVVYHSRYITFQLAEVAVPAGCTGRSLSGYDRWPRCRPGQRQYGRCEPLTNPTHDEGSVMSICPHPCPSGPTEPASRRLEAGLGLAPSIPVRSKRLGFAWPRPTALHLWSESSAVEPGEGQTGNVG